jgi:hypothetical protein
MTGAQAEAAEWEAVAAASAEGDTAAATEAALTAAATAARDTERGGSVTGTLRQVCVDAHRRLVLQVRAALTHGLAQRGWYRERERERERVELRGGSVTGTLLQVCVDGELVLSISYGHVGCLKARAFLPPV